MGKPFYHNKAILKAQTLALAVSVLQFFAPVANPLARVSCCDAKEMQCCQGAFPARMVCCIGDAERGLDGSTPTQATVEKSSRWQFDHTSISAHGPAVVLRPTLHLEPLPSFHPKLLSSTKRHIELSTFLI